MKAPQDLLDDLLLYVDYIERFTGEGQAAFEADTRTQLAVIRAYEVIGEIIKRLPQALLDRYPDVEWKALKGFRDFLIHQYDVVDLTIVWSAVQKLATLRTAVLEMRHSLEEDSEE